MPGVNFDLVRQHVSMEAVLRLLEFEPTSIRGDALELWSASRGIGVYRAALELCESLGIDVPWITRW